MKDINEMKSDRIKALKAAVNSEFALSLFMPIKVGDGACDAAFLYISGSVSNKKGRPFACAVFSSETGAVLEYRNAFVNDFVDSSKYPMKEQLDYSIPGKVSVKEHVQRIKLLQEQYAKIRCLALKVDLTDEEKAEVKDYGNEFFKAVPVDLLPFYEALSPEFYKKIAE